MAKKAGFLKQAGQIAGNLGKAYIDYNLSAVGATDVIPDSAYKGDTSEAFGKATGILGNITKAAAPAALNLIAPGAGTALKAVQSGVSAGGINKPLGAFEEKKVATENKTAQPSFMGTPNLGMSTYTQYKRGGKPKTMVVNIEKDELEVDGETGEVISDYKSKPKHPKGKDVINVKGNVQVSSNSIIIPAKHREKYLKGDKSVRMSLIKDILAAQASREATPKMEGGGLAPEGEGQALGSSPAGDQSGSSLSGIGQGAAALATSIPQYFFHRKQAKESEAALNELQKQPLANYNITPEQTLAYNQAQQRYGRALGDARTGFAPAQAAAYNQRLASANRTALENSKRMAGGNLAQATNAAINSQNINALLDFAARDAEMQKQNQRYADTLGNQVSQYGRDITNQRNMQTGLDIRRRDQKEQALGTALQQGKVGKTNAQSNLLGGAAVLGTSLLGA